MSFTMEKVKHPQGQCPPKIGSSKKDISKCAQWTRVSKGLLSPLFGDRGVIHYPVFQIVDRNGNRIQPYYDAYVSYAMQTCSPSPKWLRWLGADDDANAFKCPSAMLGQFRESKSKTKCGKRNPEQKA